MAAKRNGSGRSAGPGPYHAEDPRVRPPLGGALVEPRRDLHRFRVRPRPGCRGREGISVVPLLVNFGSETFQRRRRPVDRGVLGADDRPGRAVPDDRGVVARASSRRPTRPRSRTAPRRSSRSTSRARCRGRSRAPRSPATCCPTARSTSSIRSEHRWPRASSPSWAWSWRPRAGRRPRSPRSSRRARRTCACTSPLETLEYLKRGGRISGAQAAIGTLLSVKPIIAVKDGVVTPRTASAPGRRRASGSSSSSASGRSSDWRSCTR